MAAAEAEAEDLENPAERNSSPDEMVRANEKLDVPKNSSMPSATPAKKNKRKGPGRPVQGRPKKKRTIMFSDSEVSEVSKYGRNFRFRDLLIIPSSQI